MSENERIGAVIMTYAEREKLILEYLEKKEILSLTTACELTGASVATMRRDFDTLQEKALAVRSHGSIRLAQKQRKSFFGGTEILDDTDREKDAIAAEAAKSVMPGESIFIGTGKTCNMLAARLGSVERLTVVTTSITAVLELVEKPNVHLTLLGGDVHTGKNFIETMDSNISQTLRSFYFDKVFITMDGIDPERGYTVQDKTRIPLYTQLSRMTRRLYILVDSKKFDHRAFATVFPPDKTCRIITTKKLPQKYASYYGQRGIPCTMVAVE
jgi:DeoR/GlpR family transcriptional regulator of sugar metabolism